VIRALNLGVIAGRDGLTVREAFYTRRLAWSELTGATVNKMIGYRFNIITYVPVLHLRNQHTIKVHALGGYRGDIAHHRVELLNELISGRRRI
jgi:hypothetical protein